MAEKIYRVIKNQVCTEWNKELPYTIEQLWYNKNGKVSSDKVHWRDLNFTPLNRKEAERELVNICNLGGKQ